MVGPGNVGEDPFVEVVEDDLAGRGDLDEIDADDVRPCRKRGAREFAAFRGQAGDIDGERPVSTYLEAMPIAVPGIVDEIVGDVVGARHRSVQFRHWPPACLLRTRGGPSRTRVQGRSITAKSRVTMGRFLRG